MAAVLVPIPASELKTYQHIHKITDSGPHYVGMTESVMPRRSRWGIPRRRTEITVLRKSPVTGEDDQARIIAKNGEKFLVTNTAW